MHLLSNLKGQKYLNNWFDGPVIYLRSLITELLIQFWRKNGGDHIWWIAFRYPRTYMAWQKILFWESSNYSYYIPHMAYAWCCILYIIHFYHVDETQQPRQMFYMHFVQVFFVINYACRYDTLKLLHFKLVTNIMKIYNT